MAAGALSPAHDDGGAIKKEIYLSSHPDPTPTSPPCSPDGDEREGGWRYVHHHRGQPVCLPLPHTYSGPSYFLAFLFSFNDGKGMHLSGAKEAKSFCCFFFLLRFMSFFFPVCA